MEARESQLRELLGTVISIVLLVLALGVWACLWVPPWP